MYMSTANWAHATHLQFQAITGGKNSFQQWYSTYAVVVSLIHKNKHTHSNLITQLLGASLSKPHTYEEYSQFVCLLGKPELASPIVRCMAEVPVAMYICNRMFTQ